MYVDCSTTILELNNFNFHIVVSTSLHFLAKAKVSAHSVVFDHRLFGQL